jgi:hypothetical protein
MDAIMQAGERGFVVEWERLQICEVDLQATRRATGGELEAN